MKPILLGDTLEFGAVAADAVRERRLDRAIGHALEALGPVSTPSQTAWALLGLMAAGEVHSEAVARYFRQREKMRTLLRCGEFAVSTGKLEKCIDQSALIISRDTR